jgi:glycosyltransferase involved in cell wall biosynthesis
MAAETTTLRVLYSFPHKIGAERICTTAWHQVVGAASAGASVSVFPGAVRRPLPPSVQVEPTLARGALQLPYRVVGQLRALRLHDAIVARRLRNLAGDVDLVHLWPLGALETLKVAKRLGIPTVLERPNAHTRFAYEVVRNESERLGVVLPTGHEHAYNEQILAIEEEEYRLADFLLCPSEFVRRTFLERGFSEQKLLRHIYGYDESVYREADPPQRPKNGLTMLFVGVAAVRKGLHFGLEAWLNSSASRRGRFLVAGDLLPAYAERLDALLKHPSVRVLGYRNDAPELMRQSDVFVLPSIEEGSPLACAEAIGSGCVPLVSDVCSEFCVHGKNSLVHSVGDVETLANHMTLLDSDRNLLERLRAGVRQTAPQITWANAGVALLEAYAEAIRRTLRVRGHIHY